MIKWRQMQSTQTEEYIINISKDHKAMEKLLKTQWDIDTVYFENIAWGYNTTAYYIKSTKADYLLRTAKYTTHKALLLKKDIYLSGVLAEAIPTSNYLPTINDKNYKIQTKRIFKLSKFIEGTPPFDLSFAVLDQIITHMIKIHDHDANMLSMKLPKLSRKTEKNVLLHGDLSPSNVLISHGKVVGILDFEKAMLGPIEYDVARTTVLCWFRMINHPFDQVANYIKENYEHGTKKELDIKLLKKYYEKTIKSHLNNVAKHKTRYDSVQKWEEDHKFAKFAHDSITSFKL